MITPEQFLDAQPETSITDSRQDQWWVLSTVQPGDDPGTKILNVIDPCEKSRRLSLGDDGKTIIDYDTREVIKELNATNVVMIVV